MTWREEQDLLEKAFINRLKVEHGIEEVTTKRQAKTEQESLSFLSTVGTESLQGTTLKTVSLLSTKSYVLPVLNQATLENKTVFTRLIN